MAGYDTGSNFKRSLIGLNSELSFSKTGCLTRAKESSLPYFLLYLPNPSAWAGYDTGSNFKRSWIGLNSELSFSKTGCLTRAKESSLPYFLLYLPNPSAWAGYDTGSNFKRSLIGLNSELSFSKTGCLTRAKEPSLPYYLHIAGETISRFIPFPRVLELSEINPRPGFELLSTCPFPRTITIIARTPLSAVMYLLFGGVSSHSMMMPLKNLPITTEDWGKDSLVIGQYEIGSRSSVVGIRILKPKRVGTYV